MTVLSTGVGVKVPVMVAVGVTVGVLVGVAMVRVAPVRGAPETSSVRPELCPEP
jgi:hypothetical protein